MRLIKSLLCLAFISTGFCQDQWGVWEEITDYDGLYFRVKYSHLNEYTKSDRKHVWKVEVRNDYSYPVKITIAVAENSTTPKKGGQRDTVKPGASTVFGLMFSTVPNGGKIFVHWKDIQFMQEGKLVDTYPVECPNDEMKQVSVEHIHGPIFRFKNMSSGISLTVNIYHYEPDTLAKMICGESLSPKGLDKLNSAFRQFMIDKMNEDCKGKQNEDCEEWLKWKSESVRG